jgi:spermidine synthase
MKKWDLLAETETPDGNAMTLHKHDGTYVIRVAGRELMSTRHYASEERLAEVACAPFGTKKDARVLIGGLGLGFTLRAALAALPPTAKVVVAELIPAVVEWNKNPDFKLAAAELKDRRTQLVMDDVGNIIAKSAGAFDAIMLDADNGTTAMNSAGNKRLYEEVGLAQVWAALRPGGLVVYWSAQAEPLFAKRLSRAGFAVEVQDARIHKTGAGSHTLLIGRRR